MAMLLLSQSTYLSSRLPNSSGTFSETEEAAEEILSEEGPHMVDVVEMPSRKKRTNTEVYQIMKIR